MLPSSTNAFPGLNNGSTEDRRAQIEHEEQLARSERLRQLEAQRSMMSPAGDRIRLWEKLHKLHLPRNANHKLLAIIARETDLSLDEIHREQLRRNAGKNTNV